MQRKKLTVYQAQQCYLGKGKSLILGNYVIVEKLGQGGMGLVLKAEHRRMERMVALKILTPAITKSPEALRRFQQEVKVAAKLTHPNIATAYDADIAGTTHFLVLEYVEGRDLASLIAAEGRLPVAVAIEYVRQAAKGLGYAHQKGVVHRDVKPSNLLLDKEGTIKILDMGLARIDDAANQAGAQAGLTQSGEVMGTVDYMAPEQALDTRKADTRADIYSLGCTLYRLLTAENMFEGETMVQKLMAHQQKPIPSLPSKRADVPAALSKIFERMVAKRPEDRYQTMAEVETALTALSAGTQVGPAGGAAPQLDADSRLSAFFASMNSHTGSKSRSQSVAVAEPAIEPLARPTPAGVTVAFSAETSPGLAAVETAPPEPTPEVEPMVDTFSQAHAAVDTDTISKKPVEIIRQPMPAKGNKRPPRTPDRTGWLLLAACGGVLLVALGVWVIIRDKDGKEISRHQIPEGGSGTLVTDPPPLPNTTPITPIGKAQPLVKTPFDAKTARQHQEAWAKHLGTKVETTNSVGAKLILIPPGEFLMGSTDEQVEAALKAAEEIKAYQGAKDQIEKTERPQHRVVLTNPFLMGATEVTVGQFKKFSASGYVTAAEQEEVKTKASPPPVVSGQPAKPIQTYLNPGYVVNDDSPAAVITWNDAVAYCNWLSVQEKLDPCYLLGVSPPQLQPNKNGFRLPTEAEWEYACRAGTTTQYSFDDDHQQLEQFGWYNKNAGGRTHAVGTKLPNPFGLSDMHGNVWEWCQDNYDHKWYEKTLANDPFGPSAGSNRVLRGGGWLDIASRCRTASRGSNTPSNRYNNDGFRVVRVLDTAATTIATSGKPKDLTLSPPMPSVATKPTTPSQSGVAPPAEPKVDYAYEREIAEWAIKSGGLVTIVDSKGVESRRVSELPNLSAGSFSVRSVELTNYPNFSVADAERLSKLRDFRRIDFSSCPLTAEAIAALVKCRGLTTLYIGKYNYKDNAVDPLLAVLKLQQLHTLALIYTSANDTLVGRLGELQNLATLKLSGCKQVSDNGLSKFAESRPSKLFSIDLTGTSVGHSGVAALLNVPHLSDLNLNSININDASLQDLTRCPPLSIVHLANTKVTSAGTTKLQEAIGCQIAVTNNGQLPALYSSAEYRNATRHLIDRGYDVYADVNGVLRSSSTAPWPDNEVAVVTSIHTFTGPGKIKISPTDLDLKAMAKLSDLRSLNVGSIPAGGIHELASLKNLTNISVDIAEPDFRHLIEFKKLRRFTTTIREEAGLEHVLKLPHLQYLELLPGSKLSEHGFQQLQAATQLTEVKVHTRTPENIAQLQGLADMRPDMLVWDREERLLPRITAASSKPATPLPTNADPHRAAAERMFAIGGRVTVVVISTKGPAQPITQAADLPPEPFKVTFAEFRTQPSPDDLRQLAAIKIENVSLLSADDNDVEVVAGILPDLVQLNLTRTKITDRSFQAFASLKNLKYLIVAGCALISDEGVRVLRDSATLLDIHVSSTPVTGAGLADLKHVNKVMIDRVQCANLPELLVPKHLYVFDPDEVAISHLMTLQLKNFSQLSFNFGSKAQGDKISPATREMLAQKFPHCKITWTDTQ